MKEFQELKTWAEAERLKGEKYGKEDNNEQWWHSEGMYKAFNLVVTKAELLLASHPNSDTPPQLNKHDCSTLRELLVQMQSSLTTDSENSDLIKSYRKKCKIDLEFVSRVIQLIDVFQPVAYNGTMLYEGKRIELLHYKLLIMLNRIKNAWIKYIKPCFYKADVTCRFSVGQRGEDGFAPLLKDGQATNVRLYLWDREEVERLQRIAAELQNGR